MHTTVVVDLVKAVPTPWPRIESDTHLMSIGCARPLEDAFRIAWHDLVTWIASLTSLDTLDAYQLLSQAGQSPAGNVCDPHYSMLAKVDKRLVPPLSAYQGVHARLRARSASL
jgi:amidase